MSPLTDPTADLTVEDLGRVHLIGVGGAGMSGIAMVLAARGVRVSGSDAADGPALATLRAAGVDVSVGHDGDLVTGVDTVVVSTAVRQTNPELARANDLGLRVIHRSRALATLMSGRRGVAVAGTHGKTTTTSMLTVALRHAGLDPSFAIGGELTQTGENARDGAGDVFVAEADESDGSFLLYAPSVAIVTNVEADHLDHYGDDTAYRQAFEDFAARVVDGGALVVCADDPGAAAMAARAGDRGVRVITYGETAGVDVRLTDVDVSGAVGSGAVERDGRLVGRLALPQPGRHNLLNATAAFAAAVDLGADPAAVLAGLATFGGARRRFELKGTAAGVRVFDDYSHHPTEVRAALAAARGVAGDGRVLVVFQPHLFSRTRLFAADFGAALGAADEVFVLDVYGAREDPEPGVTGELVVAAVPLPADRVRSSDRDAVAGEVARRAHGGDIVLTIGAGDVTTVGPEILRALEALPGSASSGGPGMMTR